MLHLGTKLEVRKPTEVIQQEERSEVKKKREAPETEARELRKGEYKLLLGGGRGSKGKEGHCLRM